MNLPTHNVVVEQLVVEPKEKTVDDVRAGSKEVSTDLKRPNARKPTGRHTVFSHLFPKIRPVELVTSQRPPELCVGTARKREETVFIIDKKFLML